MIPSPGRSGDYEPGTTLVLEAIPKDGSEFKSWTGDKESQANPLTVTIDEDLLIVAVFSQRAPKSLSPDSPSIKDRTAAPDGVGDAVIQPIATMQREEATVQPLATTQPAEPPSQTRHIVVNGIPLSDSEIKIIEDLSGRPLPAGTKVEWWYDPKTGIVGFPGKPMHGRLWPELEVGGPLRADASNGDSGVFLNGRELTSREAEDISRLLGTAMSNRYSLDADLNLGIEGGARIGNLAELLEKAKQKGYFERTEGGYIGSDGKSSYFFDPETGCSVVDGIVSC